MRVSVVRRICGPVFAFAGLLHFAIPEVYERIVPPYLPFRRFIVHASGVAEFAGGVGLMTRWTRRPAGGLLIATMVAVFPANVHMALHPEQFRKIPRRALVARLPLQSLFIAWIAWAMSPTSSSGSAGAEGVGPAAAGGGSSRVSRVQFRRGLSPAPRGARRGRGSLGDWRLEGRKWTPGRAASLACAAGALSGLFRHTTRRRRG